MALTDNLGAPVKEVFIDNDNALHRYTLLNVAAAAPVVPVNILGIQDVAPGAVTYKKTFEGMQQGGRGERRKIQLQPEYNVDVKIFLKDAMTLIPALLGETWGTGGTYGMPLAFEDKPLINLESIYRLPNGTTHAGSLVCPDLILKDWVPNFGADGHITNLPFYSKFMPFYLKGGVEMVYDVFAADGSANSFTLSATPVDLVDVSDRPNLGDLGWVLDNCVYVKVRASGADTATLQLSGFTLTGTALAFTTAPAAGSKVEVYYAKASA